MSIQFKFFGSVPPAPIRLRCPWTPIRANHHAWSFGELGRNWRRSNRSNKLTIQYYRTWKQCGRFLLLASPSENGLFLEAIKLKCGNRSQKKQFSRTVCSLESSIRSALQQTSKEWSSWKSNKNHIIRDFLTLLKFSK